MFKVNMLSVIENIYNYNSNEKKLILEPMCVLLKLILLKHKPDMTKVSIKDNSVYFIEPSPYQGLLRAYNGDKRDDLHNIYKPLLQCMEWYKLDSGVNRFLYTDCLLGLDKLIKSYDKDSIVHHTLVHYKSNLNDYLNGKQIEEEEKEISPLIENLKDFWTTDDIFISYNMVKRINDESDDSMKRVYIESLENIVNHKETLVKRYIQKNSTSY